MAQCFPISNNTPHSDGTWLMITSIIGLTVGFIRIDDCDHQISLSEIRDKIHNKLNDTTEYSDGFNFGIGSFGSLSIVKQEQEHHILAQELLPSVTVVSTQNAQAISNTENLINTVTAMECNISEETAQNILRLVNAFAPPNPTNMLCDTDMHAHGQLQHVQLQPQPQPHPKRVVNTFTQSNNTANEHSNTDMHAQAQSVPQAQPQQQNKFRGNEPVVLGARNATKTNNFQPGNDEFDKCLEWLRKSQNEFGSYPSVRMTMKTLRIGFDKANAVIKELSESQNMTMADFKKQKMVIHQTSKASISAQESRKNECKQPPNPNKPISEHKRNMDITEPSNIFDTFHGNEYKTDNKITQCDDHFNKKKNVESIECDLRGIDFTVEDNRAWIANCMKNWIENYNTLHHSYLLLCVRCLVARIGDVNTVVFFKKRWMSSNDNKWGLWSLISHVTQYNRLNFLHNMLNNLNSAARSQILDILEINIRQ